ncbi:hypothetical protein ACIBSW_18880 [Actinoplanes sp. NPDC049668]|uniref:hypothetical protein n=1 Tax=unclassified Actinoplanes TaxID=2626549 RepID=UPI00339DB0F0
MAAWPALLNGIGDPPPGTAAPTYWVARVGGSVVRSGGCGLAGTTMAVGATRIWPPKRAIIWPGLRRGLSVDETLAYARIEFSFH